MTSSDRASSGLKKFAERFAHSLLGKQQPDNPDVQIRSAASMVQELCTIPETDWWKYAFNREPINGRFSDVQRAELYEKACACGRQKARELKEQYGNISCEELAVQFGLDVVFQDRPQSSHRVLFADFQEPKTIHVYQEGVQKGNVLLEDEKVREVMGVHTDLTSVLLAHELFHVIELKNPDIWTKRHRVQLWKIGFLCNNSPVAVLSEIAAMAFAKEMNQLTFSPYVLDAFLVYGYSPSAASALYEEMIEAVESTPVGNQSLDICLSE